MKRRSKSSPPRSQSVPRRRRDRGLDRIDSAAAVDRSTAATTITRADRSIDDTIEHCQCMTHVECNEVEPRIVSRSITIDAVDCFDDAAESLDAPFAPPSDDRRRSTRRRIVVPTSSDPFADTHA